MMTVPTQPAVSAAAAGSSGSAANAANIVVSIDFGTSHSGYALAKVGLTQALSNPSMASQIGSMIYVRDNWPGATSRYPKTLSAVLYDYDSQPIAHGDLALTKYLDLRGSQIQQHALIRRVKLLLAEDIHYNDPLLMKFQLEPSQVISDFLSFMKADIEVHLERAGYKDYKNRKITWVMTIPAMWTENAKKSMEIAAKAGGLLDNGGQVVFCLEPEAAILSSAMTTNLIQRDDRVLVLDMGGGTVDLAAFQVCESADGSTWHGLKFNELVQPEGRTCGATFFDDAFHDFLRHLLGEQVFDSIGADSNVPSLLFSQWEHIKRTFEGASDSSRWLRLDVQLQKKMSAEKVTELTQQNRYDADRGEVCIYRDDIIKCFEKVYPSIVEVTENMMKKAIEVNKPINKLLCVGGFSEMTYMKRRIYETFGSRGIDIIFPLNAGGSVVQGALLYGINPDSVSSRRARHSYGIEVVQRFCRSYHGQIPGYQKYLCTVRGVRMIRAFFPLIRIGDELQLNQPMRLKFPAAHAEQTLVKVTLYASGSRTVPMFVDESCKEILTTEFPCSMTPALFTKQLEFAMDLRFTAEAIFMQFYDPTNNWASYQSRAEFNPFAHASGH